MLSAVVWISLIGISLSGHNVPLITCPTCENHVCDLSSLVQCEVCEIHIPHSDQPPQDVKCVHAGHCRADNHHHCCSTEACVESIFGKIGGTTIQAMSHAAASFAGCPHCHGGTCDFINRDICFMCKFDLHDGHLPHVHCMKEHEHCVANQNTLCCKDESCVAKAFGSYYVQSHHSSSHNAIHTTTASSTTPVETSPSNTNSSSSTRPPTSAASTTTNHITEASSIKGGGHNVALITCPTCNHHVCDLSSLVQCEFCDIHVPHSDQPPVDAKCVQAGHCHVDKHHHCCSTEACVESFFGKIGGTTIQTMPHAAGSTVCPHCTKDHGCTFESCENCLYRSPAGHLPQFKGCVPKGHQECNHHDNKCCNDSSCIYELFGQLYLTTPSQRPPSSTHVVQSTTPVPTSKSTTTAVTTQRTTQTSATSDHNLTVATSTYPAVTTVFSPTTPAVSPTETTTLMLNITQPSTTKNASHNCIDEIEHCALYQSMGACHALPQQEDQYEVAFKCQKTCDRCHETYHPLTTLPTTIGTTRAPLNCQVCGDYENNNPCSTASIYLGSSVPCPAGSYCMTDIIEEGGNTKTYKRCVNETVCKTLWLAQTSDQDQCIQYGTAVTSGDFSCHFCCIFDKCNRGLIPEKSSFYTVS
ncbi:uncharacterized protein LOC111124920 isoform X2 [Crassostrea virginica]